MTTVERCFPESLRVPELGSADLLTLRQDLASKIANARSPGAKEQSPPQPVSATLARTANGAATYASSGSARVDFFFKYKGSDPLAEDTQAARIDQLLHQAWQEDAADTLRLIALLRDVREGKGEQKLFHECAMWLAKHHPLTLITNLSEVVKVGYWKDLLEITVRQCVSAEVRNERAQQATTNKLTFAGRTKGNKGKQDRTKGSQETAWRNIPEVKQMRKKSFRKHLRRLATDQERQEAKAERAKQTARKQQLIADYIATQKKAKKVGKSEVLIKKISVEPVFQLLHLTVAVLFAEQLQRDLETLKKGKSDVSLAAKWAPTPARSHDKDTFMAARIAELLFPASQHRSQDEPYSAYVARAKQLYHKQVLVPLRACLDIPEVYMSANAWDQVKYTRVASVCMKNNKKRFEEHDKERFEEYLTEVRAGNKKIASGALKPHVLVREAMRQDDEPDGGSTALSLETMELQWKSYVANLKASGSLTSAMAVCDVSGSMCGEPMQVAIALSLLVAEVTAPPFNKTVCTFSSRPQLHTIKGESLVSKVGDMVRMDWQQSTNLSAVFTLILQRALASNLPPEQMIGTLFIFSDMQFDQAVRFGLHGGVMPAHGQTNYKTAQAEFEEQGYKLPKVVFWNLQGDGDDSMPVTHREDGTALVSGFSGQLLKLFMAGASELEKFDAFNVMKQAIATERYNDWKVVD